MNSNSTYSDFNVGILIFAGKILMSLYMSFLKFAFSFLFVRNWHTGELELSRPRMALFCGAIFLIMLALTIISILQAPVEYVATP